MFVLTTTQDTPTYLGLSTRRTYPILGIFDTFDDACSYAHNVCGFATSAEFSVDEDKERMDDATLIAFCERWDIAMFATSRCSVVACSFKPLKGSLK